MATLKKILYPTDFSENAANAFLFASKIAQINNGELALLKVFDVPLMAPANIYTTREKTMEAIAIDMHTIANDKLHEIADENKTIKTRCIVKEGDVKDEILKTSENEKNDLIVMGTKGETAEKVLFMGSVTKSIIQHSSCPVLAIPEGAKYNGFSNILYTTNLQHDETNVINYIVEFAKLYDASITVLHVDSDNSNVNWSVEELIGIINNSPYPKISYKEIVVSDPIDGINDYIKSAKPDMIAMTTNTTSIFDKLVHKSLTKQLLLHTHIPLLAFNRKEYDTIFLG